MANNIELNAGTGGATLATDDIAGVHYQIVKLAVGAEDSATLIGNANPIPISDAGSSITVDGTFWQATQPVSAASLPLPTGASTSANQTTIIGHLDGVEGLLTITDGNHALVCAPTGSGKTLPAEFAIKHFTVPVS